ncbi:MAG: DUF1015 family protein [Candidatus Hydrothermales bacterium]
MKKSEDNFLQKFRALFFTEKEKNFTPIRTERYFSFLSEGNKDPFHPFYDFVKITKIVGFEYIEYLIGNGFLKFDERESYYLYEQEFRFFGRTYLRRGLLCSFDMKFSDRVLPHENVFDFGVEIHKEFYEKSRLNFEAILLLYKGEKIDNFIENEELVKEIIDEFKEIHRIKRCEVKNEFFEVIKKSNFVIADGHHRFEASKRSKSKKRLVLLLSVFDENLKILPTHRALNLEEEEISPFIKKSEKIKSETLENLVKEIKNPYLIITYKDEFYLLKCEKELSVEYLHEFIIKGREKDAGFYRDHLNLLEDIKRGKFNTGFILPPVLPETVYEYAQSGIKLPQKSSDFYPKALCGFIGLLLV